MKSMMLVRGAWGNKTTFKMIPVVSDSPYNEGIYDLDSKVLALIGKEKKQSMYMVPKLDDFGDVKPMKIGKRSNGKDYAEERKTIDTYYEYYVENPEEIKAVINLLAINADTFDIAQYLDVPTVAAEPVSSIITV
jgi:hypothetical protein